MIIYWNREELRDSRDCDSNFHHNRKPADKNQQPIHCSASVPRHRDIKCQKYSRRKEWKSGRGCGEKGSAMPLVGMCPGQPPCNGQDNLNSARAHDLKKSPLLGMYLGKDEN